MLISCFPSLMFFPLRVRKAPLVLLVVMECRVLWVSQDLLDPLEYQEKMETRSQSRLINDGLNHDS